jgi:hypothetical protein
MTGTLTLSAPNTVEAADSYTYGELVFCQEPWTRNLGANHIPTKLPRFYPISLGHLNRTPVPKLNQLNPYLLDFHLELPLFLYWMAEIRVH